MPRGVSHVFCHEPYQFFRDELVKLLIGHFAAELLFFEWPLVVELA